MRRVVTLILAAGLAAAAPPLAAQDRYPFVAFAAEFDADAPVLLKGRIQAVEWSNPRVRVTVEVPQPGGPAQIWHVMGASALELGDKGVGPSVLAVGRELIVRGYRAKDKGCEPACKAVARDVSFTDGSAYYLTGEVGRATNHRTP